METTVEQIAQLVSGKIEGDPKLIVKGVSAFDAAKSDEVTFASAPRYLDKIDETKACAVIVPRSAPPSNKVLIRVSDPYVALAKISDFFYGGRRAVPGISPDVSIGANFVWGEGVSIFPRVVIGKNVILGSNVVLHAGVVIGDGVQIGNDALVHPNASILENCRIGNRVIIHSGSVIGSDGFGFALNEGRYHKIPQIGIVRIDDDVEIGACNTIDRATFGQTWIKRGVKTDNLVHIAHNVVVGENTVLVAQVGIAGSVSIGDQCILAGQAGVGQHLRIGNRVTIGPQAGVTKSIPDGQIMSGTPSIPHRLWLKVSSIVSRLPEMKNRLRKLEKRIDRLEDPQDGPKTR